VPLNHPPSAADQLVLKIKTAWRNGTTVLVTIPLALVQRRRRSNDWTFFACQARPQAAATGQPHGP
jgi:hypothetical protein